MKLWHIFDNSPHPEPSQRNLPKQDDKKGRLGDMRSKDSQTKNKKTKEMTCAKYCKSKIYNMWQTRTKNMKLNKHKKTNTPNPHPKQYQ